MQTNTHIVMNLKTKTLSALTIATLAGLANAQANYGTTVPRINTFDRDQVVNLWRTFAYTLQTSDRNVAPNWSGSIAACNPGTTAKGYQQLVANQLNMYRALIGQANVTLDTEEATAIAQASTLPALADQIAYGHDIPPTAKCYSEMARLGARTSQIAFNPAISQPSPIAFFDDSGAGNYMVGHRQQLMASELRYMAFGNSIDASKEIPSSVGLRTNFGAPSAVEAPFIAWPSAGFFPAQLLPVGSKRWSFGCPECDAKDATVSVNAGGVTARATREAHFAVEPFNGQIVFLLPDEVQSQVGTLAAIMPFWLWPTTRDWPDVLAANFADYPVDITVSGMKDQQGRTMADIKYRVTIINPDNATGKVMPTRRYDGMWVAGSSGTGLTINTNTTGSLTARWFTSDTNGQPIWYTLADGRWTTTSTYTGKLFVTPSTGQALVGGATLAFSGGSSAMFSYTVGGASGSLSMTRQLAGPESYVPMTHNYTGEWTTGSQATSVLALAQDYRGIDGVWLTQDSNGRPAWHRISPQSVVWDSSVVVAWSGTTNNNAFTASMTPGFAAAAGGGGRLSFTANRQPLPSNYSPNAYFVPDENNATIELSLSANGPVAKFSATKQSNAIFGQGDASVALSRRGGIDLDGNGKSQLVVRNDAAGQMQVGRLVNNQFQWSTATDPGAGFRVLGAADLAGTGKSDLLFQSMTQGEFGDVIAWQGFNPANAKLVRSVKVAWKVQALGDMDGDGKGDLVWRWQGNDADTGVSYIWFTDINGPSPVNQVRKRGGAPLSWSLLGAADLNGDGAADIVYVAPDNQIRVLMATGSATAPRTCANYAASSLPAAFIVLKFADFTGARRGGDRLISLGARGVQLPIYTGDPNDRNASCTGAGSAASISTVTTSLGVADVSWNYMASGDFNGDGVFDIAWRQGNGNLAVWLIPLAGAPVVVPNAGSIPTGFAPIALQ